ncbi:unnamed protein product [Haemonchus placei]|uniref:Secreted protein n=1 Tax=Haemonchus placei TaxID=6290 RepID=A0A0N4X8T3_HAEPC|nr:unnamed protein product [Haemonchus placei]
MQLLFLLFAAVTPLHAIRCYSYADTNEDKHPIKIWVSITTTAAFYDSNVDCPFDTQYCFKSYVEQKAFSTWLSTRSCGTPNLCRVRYQLFTKASF